MRYLLPLVAIALTACGTETITKQVVVTDPTVTLNYGMPGGSQPTVFRKWAALDGSVRTEFSYAPQTTTFAIVLDADWIFNNGGTCRARTVFDGTKSAGSLVISQSVLTSQVWVDCHKLVGNYQYQVGDELRLCGNGCQNFK